MHHKEVVLAGEVAKKWGKLCKGEMESTTDFTAGFQTST